MSKKSPSKILLMFLILSNLQQITQSQNTLISQFEIDAQRALIQHASKVSNIPAINENTPNVNPTLFHSHLDNISGSEITDVPTTEDPSNDPFAITDIGNLTANPHADNHDSKTKSHDSEEGLTEAYVVYFIIIALLLGAVCVEIKKMTGLPYTPMLLVVGILLGAYSNSFGELGKSTLTILQIHPHGILLIFIPTLIFESAYNIDPFIVKKELVQILLLAVPGVAIGAVIIGLILNVVLGYGLEFPMSGALTIASIICATDPVAVVALLKEVGAPAKFSVLLEGESLLNDGTAMVFFIIFSSVFKNLEMTGLGIFLKFIQLTVGGVLLGFVACMLVLFWIKRIIKDDLLTANLTISTCYLTFFVGEFFLGVSGIISIVTLGVLMGNLGKVTMNPESLESIHTILSFLQYILETLLFVITGCYIGQSMQGSGMLDIWTSDVIRVILFFPLMTGARFLMLIILKPLINRWGWPIDKVDIIIMTYGGLRGSIALCLALMVAVDDGYSQRFRDLCLFYVICMISFTVLINGLTMKYVMKKVGFYPKTDAERKIKTNLRQKLIVKAVMNKSLITENRFLKLAYWDGVMEFAGVKKDLEEINKKKRRVQKLDMIGHDSIKLELLPKESIFEARLRVYHQIKANLWVNFEEALCTANAMFSLREIIDICLTDIEKPVWIWQCISENFISVEWIQTLGHLNTKPIIGYFSKRFLMSYLLNAYEILFNLVIALSEVFHKKSELPINKELVNEVFSEVSVNLESCEEYLFNFITLFPDLAVIVQLRLSAKIILNKQKEVLKTALHNGSISQDEFVKLKGKLDKRIRSLEIKNVSWDLQSIHPLKLVCPLFAKLPERCFSLLAEKYTEDVFPKNAKMLTKGKPAPVVYIVSSGSCIEEYDNINIRKGVGSVFSFANLVNSTMTAMHTVTTTEPTRVLCIQGKFLLDVMAQEPEFELSVYRSAFLKLMKNHKELTYFTESPDFHLFLSKTKIEKVKKNKSAVLEYGGFLFAGELTRFDFDTNRKIVIEESEIVPALNGEYIANANCVILQFDALIGPDGASVNENNRSHNTMVFNARETLADVIRKETDAELQYQIIENKHMKNF